MKIFVVNIDDGGSNKARCKRERFLFSHRDREMYIYIERERERERETCHNNAI